MPEKNWRQSKILITGAGGFVGSNLSQRFSDLGIESVTTDVKGNVDIKCDLCNQAETTNLFNQVQPEAIFHLAAKVGGIYANVTQKADFYLLNTLINTNVLAEVQRRGIKQVYAMGAGCAYPKQLENEILNEPDFLNGIPEATNDSYAYSKRNMLVHLLTLAENQDFRYLYFVPSNLYGPFDNFHPTQSHAVPGLINRFLQAAQDNAEVIKIWGDGTARRDFLYVDDLIDAMILACDHLSDNGPVNIATGGLTSIKDLAETVSKLTDYRGKIAYDTTFPEGQKQRVFNVSKITALGWQPKHTLQQGLNMTIDWYKNRIQSAKAVIV